VKAFQTLVLTATLAALLGACTSTPIAPPAEVAQRAATPVPPASTPTITAVTPNNTKPVGESTVKLPAYLDPKSELNAARSVFFGFDEFAVAPNYQALIERHGQYLSANPKLTIRIEGNTDERGGAEYNLALGQKRAEAVRQALKIMGVKDAQMEAISWGKEKPRAAGHDEDAWAQNRRADLQYPKQ
jgi:peptidoglycan-associated lipoprotein